MTANRENAVTIVAGVSLGAIIAAAVMRLFPNAVERSLAWVLDGFLASLNGLFLCF